MLPTASSPPAINTVGASPGPGANPYLELENHLHFKSRDCTVTVETVLYSRNAELTQPQSLKDKLLAPFRSALAAVRAWRAKNWVVHYVESNFLGAEPAKAFLQSVRAEGKVRRDDFLCLLLSDKVNGLSDSRHQTGKAHSGSSLDTANRDAMVNGLVRQTLRSEGFAADQVRAFVDYLHLGQVSEPDAELLWDFASRFGEKIDEQPAELQPGESRNIHAPPGNVRQDQRVMGLLKPRVDQLSQALRQLDRQREIRQREHGRRDAGNARARGQTPTGELSNKPISMEARKALSGKLEEFWSSAGPEALSGLPHIIKGRELFLRYLRGGLSGMSEQDVYRLRQFADSAHRQKEFHFPVRWHQDAEAGWAVHVDAALAELRRLDAPSGKAPGNAQLRDTLTTIMVSSKLNRSTRLTWTEAVRPLLDFANHRRLPVDEAARLSLEKLTDLGTNPLEAVRDAKILDSAQESYLYELIVVLRTSLRESSQPQPGSDQ